MKDYEMPYSFIFTDEELCDLWSYYRRIAQIIRCVEERHSLAITDSEVHAGVHFRAKNIVEECRLREAAGRGKFIFNEDNDTFEVTD